MIKTVFNYDCQIILVQDPKWSLKYYSFFVAFPSFTLISCNELESQTLPARVRILCCLFLVDCHQGELSLALKASGTSDMMLNKATCSAAL
jgi:hypothetical protein